MDLIRTPPARCPRLRPRQLAPSAAAPPASVSWAALPCHLPAYAAAPSPHQRDRRPRRGLRLRNAGSEGEAALAGRRRPRFLCLHGFRTSAEILRKQVVGRWPADVTARLDLVFADAPFPAEGKSDVDGIFDPPYYEWFQFAGEISGGQDPIKCRNLDRCFSYVEELMIRQGPFDGLLGFSQGAVVSAVLAGLQEQTRLCVFRQGLAFTGVAKVKCVIVISGGKIQAPVAAARAFNSKILCPSLHFIGDDDFVKVHSEELVEAFADPLVIRHPCGHTIPNLDEKGLQTMLTFLDKIERGIWEHSSTDTKIMVSNSEAQISEV
ncbi:hypothetical protein SEVIR_7G125800v4 [Setaria viridis]|uniref:Serine hydrolase domain-containing protein n=1 Tax=Setaria viridis TaxID=4556 RepID=A0A4U6TU95_SETVI|nr:hypothetical protein SEVIR_7G125800v2 [Setaria viridis]TKW04693.1 hypothetical protein SEVIR_7G125800v2 [Setaria viridis]